MSLSSLMSSSRLSLESGAKAAMDHAEADAWSSGKPNEVSLINSLVTKGVPELTKQWHAPFSSHGMTIAILGIVCHSRPKVQPNRHSVAGWTLCELGDLLVVIEDSTGAATTYNSLLLQAKLYTGFPKSLTTAGDKNQCFLYSNWGDWDYQSASFASSRDRDVTPNRAHSGARYLLLDGTNAHGSALHLNVVASDPNTSMSTGSDFELDLVGMLNGSAGRPFVDSTAAAGTKDWDEVMWDLIRVTSSSGGASLVSGGTPIAAMKTGDNGDGPGGSHNWVVAGADFGINLIYVKISSNE